VKERGGRHDGVRNTGKGRGLEYQPVTFGGEVHIATKGTGYDKRGHRFGIPLEGAIEKEGERRKKRGGALIRITNSEIGRDNLRRHSYEAGQKGSLVGKERRKSTARQRRSGKGKPNCQLDQVKKFCAFWG